MIRWMLIFLVAHLAAVAIVYGDEPAPFEPSETQSYCASLNDTYRVSRGLAPHKLDADLCKLSQRWAETMAARNSMHHGGGENIIAYGTSTVPATMTMWRNSGPHNGFLLSGTTRSGWGHAVSANGTHYWAGAFRSNPPEPSGDEPDHSPPANVSPETHAPRPGLLGWIFGRRR